MLFICLVSQCEETFSVYHEDSFEIRYSGIIESEICTIHSSGASTLAGGKITSKKEVQQGWFAWALWSYYCQDQAVVRYRREYFLHDVFRHLETIPIYNFKGLIAHNFTRFQLYYQIKQTLIVNLKIRIEFHKGIDLPPKEFNWENLRPNIVFKIRNNRIDNLFHLFRTFPKQAPFYGI